MRIGSFVKKYNNLIAIILICLLSVISFSTNVVFAQSTSTTVAPTTIQPCINNGTVVPGIASNSTDCVEKNFGLGNIDLSNFFPKLSFNDLIGAISTIILAVLVIFLGFKIIIAGYKWINNDAQDKSKKEAIKSITNGVVGIVIAFSAYFVVLFIRSLFGIGGNEQLVNCSNLYFRDAVSFHKNMSSTTLSNTTDEFQRCIKLSGSESALSNNYSVFTANITRKCSLYYMSNLTSFSIVNRQKLSQCFIDQLNNL